MIPFLFSLGAVLFSGACAAYSVRGGKNERKQLVCFLLAGALFAGEAAAVLVAPGRPVFERGIFLPGSLFTRSLFAFFPDALSAPARRALEPAFWLMVLLFLQLPRQFIWPVIFLAAVFFFEVCGLESVSRSGPLPPGAARLHALFFWMFWISLCGSFTLHLAGRGRPLPHRYQLLTFFQLIAVTVLLLLFGEQLKKPLQPPVALAHYYSWFPENWSAGFLEARLSPPVEPFLGRYQSAAREVVHQHAGWAEQAGVGCFILDWWPSRRNQNNRALQAARQFNNEERMCTALLYETLDLRQAHEKLLPGERENIVFLSEERAQGMAKQWVRLVDDYMRAPDYLRIRGRPVLFLYATRHLLGDVPFWIDRARRLVRERTGEDIYLVGDEVYFEVPAGDEKEVRLLHTFQPNWDRLRAFDAIFAYNPYDSSRKEHAGVQGAGKFLRDTQMLFQHYRKVGAHLGIPFIPMAMPGYNDRAHRRSADHFVIPRNLPDGRSTFGAALEDWVRPGLMRELPYFLITSWNEWNEGSQIEPTGPGGESLSGDDDLSGGIRYRAYGTAHLEELCRFVSPKGAVKDCEFAPRR